MPDVCDSTCWISGGCRVLFSAVCLLFDKKFLAVSCGGFEVTPGTQLTASCSKLSPTKSWSRWPQT